MVWIVDGYTTLDNYPYSELTSLSSVTADAFRQQYASVFEGAERWQNLPVPTGDRFDWEDASTYIRRPPFLEGLSRERVRAELMKLLVAPGAAATLDAMAGAGLVMPVIGAVPHLARFALEKGG